MPIYEYHCTNCDDESEVIQSFSDKPKEICSECGGQLEKMISLPGAPNFKGNGWASDGYSKKPRIKAEVSVNGKRQE